MLHFTMTWKCFCHISEVSGLIEVQHYSLLDLSDCRFSIFFRNVYIHMEDNGYWLNMPILIVKDEFLTLPNLDFITAHSSLITAQIGSVTTRFQALHLRGGTPCNATRLLRWQEVGLESILPVTCCTPRQYYGDYRSCALFRRGFDLSMHKWMSPRSTTC